MIEYSLFRIKFIKPHQPSFLHEDLSPREFFLRALEERPSVEFKRGYKWHIGNNLLFTDSTGYFAVGRTTNSTIEKYDEENGNFVEETTEKSPYTHVVFDATIGLIGIAKKSGLASSAKGIASQIERLISQTGDVILNEIGTTVIDMGKV